MAIDGSSGGDTRRRRTLTTLFVATVLFTLGDGSMQLLAAPHLAGQGVSTAAIGPVVAGYSVAALVFRFVLASVYTTKRAGLLVPLGCLIQTVAFLGIAASTDTVFLSALVALNGAGFALASTGGLAAIMDLVDGADAGPIMGWYTGSIGAGYSLAAFLGGWLADSFGTGPALTYVAAIPLLAGGALAFALRRAASHDEGSRDHGQTPERVSLRRAVRTANPLIWLATAIAVYINLTSGVIMTYFPLYGLTIGISLATIGMLVGLHSAVSAIIRFVTPPLFRRIRHDRTVLPMVILSGLGVAALTGSRSSAVLVLAFLSIGLARGMLRVASAALAAEGAAVGGRGAASGLYLAGLDIGKIIGPALGGLAVVSIGYEATFLSAAITFPLAFLALNVAASRRHDPAG